MTTDASTADERIAARLAEYRSELDELETLRTQAQREAEAHLARMQVLTQRMTAIQVATTTLVGSPPLDPEQTWLDQLTAWRKTLCDELLALPPRIRGMSLGLLKFSGGSVDDYAICRSS